MANCVEEGKHSKSMGKFRTKWVGVSNKGKGIRVDTCKGMMGDICQGHARPCMLNLSLLGISVRLRGFQ